MRKQLLILAFIVTLTGNALAGESPHLDGDGGCSMACCKAAHSTNSGSLLSKLCCKLDCKQPAGTQASSATTSFTDLQQRASSGDASVLRPEVLLYIRQVRFPDS